MNENQLQINNQNNNLPANPIANTFNQQGDKGLQVGHADKVENHQHKTVVIATGANKSTESLGTVAASGMNHDYFNLVVWSDLSDDGYITIDKERALTEHMTSFVKEQFLPLTMEGVAEIKRMPTILTTENHQYGRTDDEHMANYGLITDIREVSNGYRIYFAKLQEIPQQRLNEISENLDLAGSSKFNELNRSHWTIKNIDLVQELRNVGIPVLSM